MKNEKLEADRQLIVDAKQKGFGATIAAYTKLSGPGWLQSAITLGGGSLAGGLYVGVLAGYELMWLQPLMMILGVAMLGAISYVGLSTGRRPFEAICTDVNPVLGWGWVIATLMANLVWAMPQFSLGTAAITQNLAPGLANSELLCVGFLLVVASIIVWFYDAGGWGIKIFDLVLKAMVGTIVICFFGVVIAMTFSSEGLPWGRILGGFVPNHKLLFSPAEAFTALIPSTVDPGYWHNKVLSSQRDVMVTAAATAVGINMTFLLPYSMLKRGWDRDFRGLAVFDLSTGLFVPFLLATSCVVIAAASQFHGQADEGLVDPAKATAATELLQGGFDKEVAGLVDHLSKLEENEGKTNEEIRESLTEADLRIAAMLVKRDARQLALSLESLTGSTIAQLVFGVGVLGMAISTIIILMLINGFTICEMMGVESKGVLYRIGCILPGLTGAYGSLYLWQGDAKFWLAVPTSVFGMVLLPIAYLTFFLMMNNRRLLGEHMLSGFKRLAVNGVLLLSLTGALIGASWSIAGRQETLPEVKVRDVAFGIVILFVLAVVIAQLRRGSRSDDDASAN